LALDLDTFTVNHCIDFHSTGWANGSLQVPNSRVKPLVFWDRGLDQAQEDRSGWIATFENQGYIAASVLFRQHDRGTRRDASRSGIAGIIHQRIAILSETKEKPKYYAWKYSARGFLNRQLAKYSLHFAPSGI
jgi:hypothetical protein